MIFLSSDYLEGCHPAILERLKQTNDEQTVGYGQDPYCNKAASRLREIFGCPDADVHFLIGGTQTNTVVISSILHPYQGVICPQYGHINQHEAGAVEATGHKVIPLESHDGKVLPAQISVTSALQMDDEHNVMPGMVCLSEATELGTVYNLAELRDIYHTCRQLGLYLYIDGARLGYGLASSLNDMKPSDIAKYCDIFTVGGTKQGALFGEAVIIMNPALKSGFRRSMKQRGAMLAKGRLLGIQFLTLFEDGLYFSLARKAVDQAMHILDALKKHNIPQLSNSSTNQLFPVFTDRQSAELEKDFVLSAWERTDGSHTAFRLSTSWATPDSNVDAFINALDKISTD